MDDEKQETTLVIVKTPKQYKLLRYFILFSKETSTLYALLKISKLLISKTNLSNKNLKLCALSFFTAYGVQQYFGFYKFYWILLLITKVNADLFASIIPNKYKLSAENTWHITGIIFLYLMTFKSKNTSRSYWNFADMCYGDTFRPYLIEKGKYNNKLEIDGPLSVNCNELHPKYKSCADHLKKQILFFSQNTFKWHFKFYLLINLLLALPSIIKNISIKNNNLFETVLKITQKTAISSLAAMWNNTILLLSVFYIVPCISNKSNLKLTHKQEKLFTGMFIIPIALKIAFYFESTGRKKGLTIFFLAQIIQNILNQYYDIDNLRNKKKKSILNNKNILSFWFAIYVSMSMVITLWFCKTTKKLTINQKIFKQMLLL